MKIGVTGHQRRAGLDWAWVARALGAELAKVPRPLEGYSSLAAGADQLFAELVLRAGGRLHAVIPLAGYEGLFDGADLSTYRELCSQASVIQLEGPSDPGRAFFKAGCFVVNRCELLFAVWDGKPAHGFGGTADIVAYALSVGRRVTHIDPIPQSIQHL